jgi:glycosyltransferase involved in cell wall biosynthesis
MGFAEGWFSRKSGRNARQALNFSACRYDDLAGQAASLSRTLVRRCAMRIAFTGPNPSETGGVAYAMTVLVRALVAGGVEVDLYVGSFPDSLKDLDGLRVVADTPQRDWIVGRLGRLPFIKSVWGQMGRARAHKRLANRLVDEHRRRAYDAVYQFSQPELLALGRRRALLPPIIVHPEVHAAGELRWHRLEDALARQCESRARTAAVRTMLAVRSRLQKRDLAIVHAVVAPSSVFADDISRDYNVERSRIHVVPNPVDLDRFIPPTVPPHGRREIVFVTRLSVRKGVELVVDLSHRLDDLADGIRLSVIGDRALWSDYTPLLRGLNPRTSEFVGYVAPRELPALLSEASLLVQPSHYEPFALTVAEALACGTPVVVSDQVGAGEWVGPESSATFAAGDADAFERAVRSMLDRLDTSESTMREHARATAMESFDPAKVAQQIMRVIEGVTGAPA